MLIFICEKILVYFSILWLISYLILYLPYLAFESYRKFIISQDSPYMLLISLT